jgi:hypothetical protein
MIQPHEHPIDGAMPITMAVVPTAVPATAASGEMKKDRDYFRQRISTATIAMYRSIKAVTDILLEARMTLSPEEFQVFVLEDCQFDLSMVYKLMKMASDYRLNLPENENLLPDAWTTRYEIMQMKEETFRVGVMKNIIHKNAKLVDIRAFRQQFEGTKVKPSKKPSCQPSSVSVSNLSPDDEMIARLLADDEVPEPTGDNVVTMPKAERSSATVKSTAPSQAQLRVVPQRRPETDPASERQLNRIVVMLSPDCMKKNQDQLDALRDAMTKLVVEFPFLTGFEVEEAA